MTETKIADLVGLAEISERRNVSRNVASGWTRKHDFPRPKHQLRMGPMWDWNEVQAHLDGVRKIQIPLLGGAMIATIEDPECVCCGSFGVQIQAGTAELAFYPESPDPDATWLTLIYDCPNCMSRDTQANILLHKEDK